MCGAPTSEETAAVLAAPSSGSSPSHSSQHAPFFARATTSPSHSESNSNSFTGNSQHLRHQHHHHTHPSHCSTTHDSSTCAGKTDSPTSPMSVVKSSSSPPPRLDSNSNSNSNSNVGFGARGLKGESSMSGLSALECIEAAELLLPSMVPEDTSAKRSSGAGSSSTAAPNSVRTQSKALSYSLGLDTSEDCGMIDWASVAATTPTHQPKLSPAQERDGLVKAARDLRGKAQQRVEEASGDNELREQLGAKLRELEMVLKLMSEHLLKGHLVRIVATLKELLDAIDSWETSKGFPFLRSESTKTELVRSKDHLQKILDEAHTRAAETGHSESLPRGSASWAAVASTAGAGASVSASSWLSGETTDTFKSVANYTTEVEELPRGEAAATRPRSPPTPGARWPSKGSRRCVLVVQKAPELPGQLQQEWEQTSVTSKNHLKTTGGHSEGGPEDEDRLSKQSSVLSLC